MPDDDARSRGTGIYKQLGLPRAPGLPIPDDLRDMTMDHLFGDVWGRPELELRDRSLITVATLAALGRDDQLRLHLHGALNLGVTQRQLEEVFIHLAHYAGWPVGVQGSQILAGVLAERESAP